MNHFEWNFTISPFLNGTGRFQDNISNWGIPCQNTPTSRCCSALSRNIFRSFAFFPLATPLTLFCHAFSGCPRNTPRSVCKSRFPQQGRAQEQLLFIPELKLISSGGWIYKGATRLPLFQNQLSSTLFYEQWIFPQERLPQIHPSDINHLGTRNTFSCCTLLFSLCPLWSHPRQDAELLAGSSGWKSPLRSFSCWILLGSTPTGHRSSQMGFYLWVPASASFDPARSEQVDLIPSPYLPWRLMWRLPSLADPIWKSAEN